MVLDDMLAARIDNPNSGSTSTTTTSSDRPDEKVIEIVKRLAEFNGLDQWLNHGKLFEGVASSGNVSQV